MLDKLKAMLGMNTSSASTVSMDEKKEDMNMDNMSTNKKVCEKCGKEVCECGDKDKDTCDCGDENCDCGHNN